MFDRPCSLSAAQASAAADLFCSSPQRRRALHSRLLLARPLQRSKSRPPQPHALLPSCARRRSRELQLEDFGIFFLRRAAQLARKTTRARRCAEPGRNVVELASDADGQRGGARSPDPKPTTADTMVPLPTSGGDGVMLRRAGQASPPVMEPIGNRKLSVGSNYDVRRVLVKQQAWEPMKSK